MAARTIEAATKVDQRVYAEQVSLLYTKSVTRPLLHIISLIIVVSLIHNHVDAVHVYVWASSLFGLNVYRIFDIHKTQKIINETTDFRVIQKRFAIGAGVLGAIYGIGIVSFLNYLPILTQVYLLMLISVIMPSGFVSFVSDRLSFNMFVYPLVIPPILWLFSQEQDEYLYIGVCAVVYLLVIKKSFKWNNETLIDAIRLKLENEQLVSNLQLVNERLTELTVIDELTQIQNRRSFDDTIEKEWLRAKRLKTPISMLMIDIDFFKQYNDKYGHIKGDECLSSIAQFMKNNLNRSTDFIGRYGGEEFCIIMPDTPLKGALNLAEKIRAGVKELKILNPVSEENKFLTISVGVASAVPTNKDTSIDLIYTSDKALYMAKNEGRNVVRTLEALEKNGESQSDV
jgi:diguanylate cyclase (GGDEF)-like protein